MGNLFTELKRRHIYRVAAAYAVVAWVLLQLFNNVAPILKLPDWTGALVLVLLVGGFPVALLFAWMHQLAHADGTVARPTTSKLDWALMGALVVVIALVSYQQLAPTTGMKSAQRPAAVAATSGSISIAVLPFVNLSGDATQEFFSDGMTEEITAALTKVPGLHVLGRTSAFEFKGQNKDLRSIGQALGATHLIEGSVRKTGNRVRITAQLVNAANDSHLWAENYDRDLTDIFAIQEDIATAIAASLQVRLGLRQGEALVPSRIKDEASYEDYLRAKTLVRERSGGEALGSGLGQGLTRLTEAARLLETVVARDPNFAPASALLSYTYALVPVFNPAFLAGATDQLRPVFESLLPKAEAAARHAIELDPKNADGYFALGYALYLRGSFTMASNAFMQGFALDPNNPDGLHFYSGMLADLGYLKEALAMRERLQALEPLTQIFRAVTSRFLLAAGRPDAALAMASENDTALTRAPIYAFQGRYAEAANLLLTIPEGRYLPGSVETAAKVLRTAPSPAPSPKALPKLGGFGFIYLYVGAPDRVLDWHEDNLKIGLLGGGFNATLWGPHHAPVRKTERFKAFVRAAGFVDYWRARGWPDLCHPVGTNDFACD